MRRFHWMLAAALLAATGIAAAQQGTDPANSKDPAASDKAHKPGAVPDAQTLANMDPVQRAGYEASKAFHKKPNSKETANAIRRLLMTADGTLPAEQKSTNADDDGDD